MKLTKAVIATLSCPAGQGDKIYFDEQLPGFGFRIRKSGVRRWVLQYEIAGQTRRVTVGSPEVLSPEEARHLAQYHLAEVRIQKLPQVQRLERDVARLKQAVQSLTAA